MSRLELVGAYTCSECKRCTPIYSERVTSAQILRAFLLFVAAPAFVAGLAAQVTGESRDAAVLRGMVYVAAGASALGCLWWLAVGGKKPDSYCGECWAKRP